MEVSNVDEVYARVKKMGVPLFRDMHVGKYREHDKVLHCKQFLVFDPDGYLLRFSTTSY
jgi:hypothetical protein